MTKTIETLLTWYKPSEQLPEKNTKILILSERVPYGDVIFTMPFAGVQGGYFLEGLCFPSMPIKDIKYWAYLPELQEGEE